MQVIGVLVNQIAIMFALIAIGVYLLRSGKLTTTGCRDLGNLLVNIVMPCVVLNAYMTERTPERVSGLLVATVLSVISLAIAAVAGKLCFPKRPLENFGTTFSNAGFMGIPLIQAVLGNEAVFYVSSFVALLNILQWLYGVYIITEDKKSISPKKIVTNPVLICYVLGLLVFFLELELPSIVTRTVGYCAGMNAPLAMISIGVYLAQVKPRDLISDKWAWLCTAVRLVLVPLLTVLMLTLVPEQWQTVRMAVLLAAAAPVGSNVAVFAQLHNKDYAQAVKSVCLSTVSCIVSIPLMILLAQAIWGI